MIQKLDVLEPAPLSNKKIPQVHYRVAEYDQPEHTFRIRFIDTVEELESIVEPWTRLTEVAIRPNLFFGPDFLIPAFKHLNDKSARILAIEAPCRKHPDGPRVLCGLLPVVSKKFYGIPLSCLEVWKHDQCFDCTPLIREDCAADVLTYLFERLGTDNGTSLLSFDTIAGDGEFQSVLTEVLYQSQSVVFHRSNFNRACFIPLEDSETYIKTKVSSRARKNTFRLERKLDKLGRLSVSSLKSVESVTGWIDDFLELESAGWKGTSKTALASEESNRSFFALTAKRLFAKGQFSMLKLAFDDRPICILCDVHMDHYAVAFKTAYDESFAEFSPGMIAELHNIHRLHRTGIKKMDSCADPNHPMINRFWKDRTRYQSIVVALRGNLSRFAVASMPLLQTTSNVFKK